MTKGKANGKTKTPVRDRRRTGNESRVPADDRVGDRKRSGTAKAAGPATPAKGRAKVAPAGPERGRGKGGPGGGAPAKAAREQPGRPAGAKRTRAQAIADVKRAQADLIGHRPTKLTPERLTLILDEVAAGKFLPQIIAEARVADPDFPAARTIREWAHADPDLSAALARAYETGGEVLVGSVREVVDDGRNDFVLTRGGYVVDQEALGRSKLRAEYYFKLASVMDSRRFGTKVELANNPERPIGGRRALEDLSEAELVAAFEKGLAAKGERDGA